MNAEDVRDHAESCRKWAAILGTPQKSQERNLDRAAILDAVAPLFDHVPEGVVVADWVPQLIALWEAVHDDKPLVYNADGTDASLTIRKMLRRAGVS